MEKRPAGDIVSTVSRHVRLTRAGQNLKGLCPFHDERTPSFNVNPTTNTFRCFGCGAHGGPEDFERMIGERRR